MRLISLATLMLMLLVSGVLAQGDGTGPPQSGLPCSPNNYLDYHNTDPGFPNSFCAYTYLPYRLRLPDSPKHINASQTTILQQQYIPGSSNDYAGSGTQNLITMGVPPPPPGPTRDKYGSSNMAVYRAATTDPLVTLHCHDGVATYGCGDNSANWCGPPAHPTYGCDWDGVQIHIPPYAHAPGEYECLPPNCQNNQDNIMEVIQPDGHTSIIFGCFAKDWTWKDGDQIAGSPGPCPHIGGMTYGSIVTEPGINPGITNAGNNPATLRVRWNEIKNGDIRHPVLVYGGCFTGSTYPALFQTLGCTSPPGLPAGVFFYLSLSRQDIDLLPATTVQPWMRPFLYAAHEHGVFSMDTGNGLMWITLPQIEECMPFVMSTNSTCTHWYNWFVAHGGGLAEDGALKISPPYTMDWRPLAQYMFVLDTCYVHGTCDDSVLENTQNPPSVAITNPSTATVSTAATSINISGTASDNVGVTQVTWSNNRTAAGGTATCSACGATATSVTWSVNGIALATGTPANIITVTAKNAASSTASTTVQVTVNPPTDTTPPSIALTQPTTGADATTQTSPITFAGTASDNIGVTLVRWTNNRGGSGDATGTTSWSASVTLFAGANVLTATAYDAAGNHTSPPAGAVTVTYTPSTLGTPPPPPLATWLFDEANGTAAQSTPSGSPLTLTTPSPSWAAGHTGTSLECTDTGHASRTPAYGGSPYSWAFWFQPVAQPLGSTVTSPIHNATWGFTWSHTDPNFQGAAWQQIGASTWIAAKNPTTLPLGNWVHLAATQTGSQLTLFVNGMQAAQTNGTVSVTPAGAWSVCNDATQTGGTSTPYGRVDELNFWNVALTPAQVLGAYQGLTQSGRPARRHVVSFR